MKTEGEEPKKNKELSTEEKE